MAGLVEGKEAIDNGVWIQYVVTLTSIIVQEVRCTITDGAQWWDYNH